MVAIRLPPPSRNLSPQLKTLKPNTKLIRIFDPTKYNAQALGFRSFGEGLIPSLYGGTCTPRPISRFDHHRIDVTSGQPQLDPERSIIYAAFTLSSCLVEIFGDGDVVEVKQQQVASIYTAETLNLLDLRGNNAMKAGTVTAIAKTANRNLSQTWSRYFYERKDLYSDLDGIIYSNAHNAVRPRAADRRKGTLTKTDDDALALYERAQSKLVTSKVKTMPLKHPALRSAIFQIAENHSLLVSPY